MFILGSYSGAVFFCFITMFCWGSWANTQKLAEKDWRFELFYWDYSLGVLFLSILSALTLGSWGEHGRGFLNDLSQAQNQFILSAFIGGVIFNLANLLLVTAIAITGMSVAFPVGIGIALVLGVIVNYVQSPAGDPFFIFLGVGLIALAIILDAKAYGQISIHKAQKIPKKGIFISIGSGLLMGLFYRFVAAAITNNFTTPEVGKLSPYSAVFIFCVGVFLSSIVFVPVFMKYPASGEPVKWTAYFKGSLRNHLTGIMGGAIWCVGMSLSILAGDRAGYAISYGLGQGATMIAALWGIFFWKEFKGAPLSTNILLTFMMLSYFIGLACIIFARHSI